MIIETENRIEKVTNVTINGRSWKLNFTKMLVKRSYEFDNGRTGWDSEELKTDENGFANIYVGRENESIKYNKLSFEVIRMDEIQIDFQNSIKELIYDDCYETITRSIAVGISNGNKVVYIQLNRKNDDNGRESYSRYYFDEDSEPGGYQSPSISGPGWNTNRDFELLEALLPYFENIYEYVPTLRKSFNHLKNKN